MGLPIIDTVLKIVDKVIPDPKAKAEVMLELQKLEQSGDLAVITGQNEINKIEAANPNLFVSGWRPAVGWTLAAGLSILLVLGPLLSWGSALAGRPIEPPMMPTEVLMTLSTVLLGMSGLRSWDKKNGVAK